MKKGGTSFLERVRSGGIEPTDSDDLKLNKSLLLFATGLISVASIVWLAIYWLMGLKLSSTGPFLYQVALACNVAIYLKSGNFNFFRVTQLALFLFFPFIVQWSIGNFITASGVILWGLLAPIGAILFFGVRESIAWFIAYIFLVALSGFFDFFLAENELIKPQVPIRTSVVFFALNFIAISTMVYLLLRYSTREKEMAQQRLIEAHRVITEEQERSERLLLNILPGPVAERLKNNEQTIADGFADVTVMFADIVNFTQVAEGLSPSQVFSMLNRVFYRFDELAEQYGLEKIKTIGDAYMVAGGLNEDPEYADSMADMAIAMREAAENEIRVNGAALRLRIGIGTGPVVAGVVGKKKFIYDLWGDTVNIASRITSEGRPDTIHVDVVTWRRLRGRFDFEGPEMVYLKGKGQMPVYRLLGRKAGSNAGVRQVAAMGARGPFASLRGAEPPSASAVGPSNY